MIRGEFDAAAADDPGELLAAYRSRLVETIETVGVESVLEQSGLSRDAIAALRSGTGSDLTLTEAAAILATDADRPDAEAVAAEARDILLLGMTTAVLDVESLASELDGVMEPKELQQKVEGRQPMTLGEYARIHYHLREHTE